MQVVIEPPRSHHQDVTGFYFDALRLRHFVEISSTDGMIAPLVNRLTFASEMPRDIEQDAPPSDAMFGPTADTDARIPDCNSIGGKPVVIAIVRMTKMAQRIDLRRGL